MSQQPEEDLERVKQATEQLSEHFDSVIIFATRHEQGELEGTVNLTWSSGNWFTRYGQVKNWVLKAEENIREGVRGREAQG